MSLNRIMCPTCLVAMVPEVVAELMLDRCPSCQGLWFDPSELDRYAGLPGRRGRAQLGRIEALDASGKLACPRCATESLAPFRAGAIYLSPCVTCGGVFLDGTDLRALDGARVDLLPRLPTEPHDRPVRTTVEVALAVAAEVFLAGPL